MEAEGERERTQAALAAMSEELQAQREAVAAAAAAAEAGVSVERCRLKPVGTRGESAWFQHLKLKCGEPRSSFAFKFNVCRYISERDEALATATAEVSRLAEAHGVAREAAERGAASEEEVAALCSRLESEREAGGRLVDDAAAARTEADGAAERSALAELRATAAEARSDAAETAAVESEAASAAAQGWLADVEVGPGGYCSTRRRMPFNSRNEGREHVG